MGKLSAILKDWDGSNQVQRRALLSQFLEVTEGMTAIDLDADLGHTTSLLFARFISSLRLRYNTKNISPLLDAIHRFTGATGGLEYAEELIESGSLLTLVEMLSLENPTENDKNSSIKIIFSISSYGMKYKEIICKVGSIRMICECLAKAKSSELKQNLNYILESLATGNPKFINSVYRALIALLPADSPNAVQLSLELLRKIQGQVEPIKELVAPLLGTLGSFHGEVRYEAKMYILSLSDSEIKSILLQGIIKTLQFNPESENLTDYVRQATSVEVLDGLIRQKSKEWIQNELIKRDVITKLIATLANTKHPESQRNAAVTLMSLSKKVEQTRREIEKTLGPLAVFWSENPEQLHEKIDPVTASALIHS